MHSDQRALFLDRDGIINEDLGHVCRIENFHFLPNLFAVCRRFRDAGFKLVVVTNQAGIAKGYYTVEDFIILSDWMSAEFIKAGAPLSGIYYCPHHPDGKVAEYRKICDCRKPAPGLLLRAQQDLRLNMSKSILVGDKDSDILAGRAAGVEVCYLMRLGTCRQVASHLTPPPIHVFSMTDIVQRLV